MRSLPLAALVAAVALSQPGCSELKKDGLLDTARAEREIRRDISSEYGVKLQSVRCPDSVKAEKGRSFRCTAKARDGSRLPVKVTQVDDEGGVSIDVGG